MQLYKNPLFFQKMRPDFEQDPGKNSICFFPDDFSLHKKIFSWKIFSRQISERRSICNVTKETLGSEQVVSRRSVYKLKAYFICSEQIKL